MDVRQGPLSRARENIAAHGLLGQIEIRLSDGLEALKEKEAQTVVIAGMGGPLMKGILERGAGQLSFVQELILQPQSDVEHFRRSLQDLPFTITDEDMVEEDGKFYPMMRLTRQRLEKEREIWEEAEYRYGRYLLKGRHPVLGEYLRREKEKLDRLGEELRLAGGVRASRRLEQIVQAKGCIQEVQKDYGFDM